MTDLAVPFFSYVSHGGRWVSPGDESWSLADFDVAERRGKRLVPVADRVVVLVDPPPRTAGGIYLPDDVHVSVEAMATVLAVPRQPPTIHAGRLKGKTAVMSDKLGDYVEMKIEVAPGMRVFLLRFAGWNSLPTGHTVLGHDRLRTLSYNELWGVVC